MTIAIPGLNDFDPNARAQALDTFIDRNRPELPEPTPAVNLHCHTFYSYNAHGLSPTGVACLLHSLGVTAGGIVDFDVLDGVEEFLHASQRLALPACAGIETRVFVPPLADHEINSPGEPGIAYHMGVGFVRSSANDEAFLQGLRDSAQQRNRSILERVNAHLDPLGLDYENDVLPLTPAGNPTERHLCAAYQAQAELKFPKEIERATFWAGKLGLDIENVRALLADPANFQNTMRRVLMKRGGVGYVQPDAESFPRLDHFNRFVAGEGAIPTVAWLDGDSTGERDPGALLDLHIEHGAVALNIIPDRNWNIADESTRARKVAQLAAIVASATDRAMPIFVGTEMNAPGQPDVDRFDAPELQPFVEVFLQGAQAAVGHTVLERAAGMGYTSAWADAHLPELSARNDFYTAIGALTMESGESAIAAPLSPEMAPSQILKGRTPARR